MVARARITTAEGAEPPVSLDLAQAKLLVMAFGGDMTALPPIPGLNDIGGVSSFLEAVEVQCSNGTKTPKFQVSSGWADVSRFSGIYPPKGTYSWRVDHFEPQGEDDRPHWIDSVKFPGSHYFYLYVECVGDGMGNPSPYSGLVLSTIMNYKVEVGEDGKPRWTTIQGGPNAGQFSKTGVAFSRFVEVVAPSWFSGNNAVMDVNNILPELQNTIKADGIVFSAFATTNEKGYWQFMHDTAIPLSADPQATTPPPPTKEAPAPPVDLTRQLIYILAGQEGVETPFSSEKTLDVTKECIPVLKKYLTPAKEKGIITAGRLQLIPLSELLGFLDGLTIGDFNADLGKRLVELTTQAHKQMEEPTTNEANGPLF
jgi:hypothetical protein